MKALISRLFGSDTRPVRKQTARLSLEGLGERTLLSATAVLSGTTLVITGDETSDQIQVSETPLKVSVFDAEAKTTRQFDRWSVTRVQFHGRDGDDRFDASGLYTLPVIAFGEKGRDTLVGGWMADWLDGGSGNDVITGGGGGDLLVGLDGDDILDAGSGNDTVYGGAGNDTILGGIGNDFLEGGDGNDFVLAGDGNDVLIGGAGGDYLYGGAGGDVLYPYTTDLKNDKDGFADYIYGEAGHDYMQCGDASDRSDRGLFETAPGDELYL